MEVLTASWPIIASTTSRTFSGGRRLDVGQLLHQRLVDREAAGGVVDDDVALACLRPRRRPAVQMSSGVAAGDVEDGDVELLAEHLELLDGGGALHVGGDEERLLALLLQVAGRAWRTVVVLPEPWRPDHHDAGRPRWRRRRAASPSAVMNATSSSWQILTKLVARRDLDGLALGALGAHADVSPSAFSFTRARNALTTPSSTSASSSESRTSRSADSTFCSVSSVSPARRFFACRKPLAMRRTWSPRARCPVYHNCQRP